VGHSRTPTQNDRWRRFLPHLGRSRCPTAGAPGADHVLTRADDDHGNLARLDGRDQLREPVAGDFLERRVPDKDLEPEEEGNGGCSARLAVRSWITSSHIQEASVTTPPDFGGRDIEEGLLEDLGGPREGHLVGHEDEDGSEWSSNEAHAPGKVCEVCGAVITSGQEVRRRADGQWMHEVCPLI
jgi:hypothetical protein